MKALVIIPAVNENVKLESALKRIKSYLDTGEAAMQIDVLVVDDGSTEPLPDVLLNEFGYRKLRNETTKGVGYAIREAYKLGLEQGYDVLMTMAGNDKDEPQEFNRLLNPIVKDEADFVQGSRYLPGGNYGNLPFYRYFATKYMHPILFSLISGQRITDSTNGFRAVRREIFTDGKIDLDQGWLDHYELEPYLFCQSIRKKYRVIEVPVSKIYPAHKLGYSKMRPFVDWWSILRPLFYLFFKPKN